MEKIKALKEELERAKKTREDLRQIWHGNRQELDKLEKERPLVFGEVALQKRELKEKEKLKETIRRLEEENEDIKFTLPWLEKREEELRGEIQDLKVEEETRERRLEQYDERKESYARAYEEERDLEKRGITQTGYIPPTTARVERIKLEELARDLGMEEDYSKFLKMVEKKFGKLERK